MSHRIEVLKDDTIRRRDVRVRINWSELREIIARCAVAEGANIDPDAEFKGDIKITINQREEGSPSYRVSKWDALVDLSLPID